MADINPIGGGHKGQQIIAQLVLSGDHGSWLAGGAASVRAAIEKIWDVESTGAGPGATYLQAMFITSERSGTLQAAEVSAKISRMRAEYPLIVRVPNETAIRVVESAERLATMANLTYGAQSRLEAETADLLRAVAKHIDAKETAGDSGYAVGIADDEALLLIANLRGQIEGLTGRLKEAEETLTVFEEQANETTRYIPEEYEAGEGSQHSCVMEWLGDIVSADPLRVGKALGIAMQMEQMAPLVGLPEALDRAEKAKLRYGSEIAWDMNKGAESWTVGDKRFTRSELVTMKPQEWRSLWGYADANLANGAVALVELVGVRYGKSPNKDSMSGTHDMCEPYDCPDAASRYAAEDASILLRNLVIPVTVAPRPRSHWHKYRSDFTDGALVMMSKDEMDYFVARGDRKHGR